jgi:5-methylcytosine-specific restriction protein A
MTVLRSCVRCGKPSKESYCRKLSGSSEQARRKRILERYFYCCHVCGEGGADQVDHRIPLGEGGADEDWNLAPIHAEPCHREKTAAEARRARA